MAQVFRSRRRYRVVVRSNDHPPPHVHALGPGLDARFRLNEAEQLVEFWDHHGDWKLPHLNELGEEIAAHFGRCVEVWRKIHG